MQQPPQQFLGPTTMISGGVVYAGGPGYHVPPPTVMAAGYVRPTVVESFRARQAVCVGVLLFILGCSAVVFNIVALVVPYDYVAYIGHGFWTGVVIITFMVLCIISAALSPALFGIGLIPVGCYYCYVIMMTPYGNQQVMMISEQQAQSAVPYPVMSSPGHQPFYGQYYQPTAGIHQVQPCLQPLPYQQQFFQAPIPGVYPSSSIPISYPNQLQTKSSNPPPYVSAPELEAENNE